MYLMTWHYIFKVSILGITNEIPRNQCHISSFHVHVLQAKSGYCQIFSPACPNSAANPYFLPIFNPNKFQKNLFPKFIRFFATTCEFWLKSLPYHPILLYPMLQRNGGYVFDPPLPSIINMFSPTEKLVSYLISESKDQDGRHIKICIV